MSALAKPFKPKPYDASRPIPYQGTISEYIFRTGSGAQLSRGRDPGQIRTGEEAYKYGLASLHPAVAPAFGLMLSGPFWVKWQFKPVNDYARYPGYERVDQVLTDCLNYQARLCDLDTFLRNMFKDATRYGYAVGEKVWTQRDTQGHQYVRNIQLASPFEFDLYEGQQFDLAEIYYRPNNQRINGDLLQKFLVATYPSLEHGNYYGRSVMLPIYQDVMMIEILEKAQAEGLRSVAIKPMIHYYDAEDLDAEDLESIRSDLFTLDSGALISLPASHEEDGKFAHRHEIKVLEDRASATGIAIISDVLKMLYTRVNRNFGLPDDMGFTTTNVGSLAKAKEQGNLYVQSIVENQRWIESIVNGEIVRDFLRHNYPSYLESDSYEPPRFEFGSVEEDVADDISKSRIEQYKEGLITREEARIALNYDPVPSQGTFKDTQTGSQQPRY